ncbi:hypothetical protein HC752_01940 [Vibrio sp. S9_S30]|uniref:hypothetical protein n=1 Tax=Vibrio sp. S9_S30 TaxID=2720226 RepID=UPI00167FFC90|nr:hypothetical protein [Vibrio sp. S9_S30]MBD1555696.1 hypothetical protein [Vibrio sp. S9_S30]
MNVSYLRVFALTSILSPFGVMSGPVAIQGGELAIDKIQWVKRSNIVYQNQPSAIDFAPIGNGTVGGSVWWKDGYGMHVQVQHTNQILGNRSNGVLSFPDLENMDGSALTPFQASLDLADGVFTANDGAVTVRVYADKTKDAIIVDMSGLSANQTQRLNLNLWPGRAPTWVNDAQNGVFGFTEGLSDPLNPTFRGGMVTAIQSTGTSITKASISDGIQQTVSADADGNLRVIFSATEWESMAFSDTGVAELATAHNGMLREANLLQNAKSEWHNRWANVMPIRIDVDRNDTSKPEALFESARTLNLYYSSIGAQGQYPITQGGRSRLIGPGKEANRQWNYYYGGDWNFNSRNQYYTMLASGQAHLMKPYFEWYTGNLSKSEENTRDNFPSTVEGVCITDNNRYDKHNYYVSISGNDLGDGTEHIGVEYCNPNSHWYTTNQYETGAAVALTLFQYADLTGDTAYLESKAEFIRKVTLFMATVGEVDSTTGKYTVKGNTFENWFYTQNPSLIVASMKALFPKVRAWAQNKVDSNSDGKGDYAALIRKIDSVTPYMPSLPITNKNHGSDNAYWRQSDPNISKTDSNAILAWTENKLNSGLSNFQNPEMEAVWPYNLFGVGKPDLALAQRSYNYQYFPNRYEWNFDATWAARLGLKDKVADSLLYSLKHHIYGGAQLTNGFSSGGHPDFGPDNGHGQIEMLGNMSHGIQESIVQYYDGVLRLGVGLPNTWTLQGAAKIAGQHIVAADFQSGELKAAAITAGSSGNLKISNPWQSMKIVDSNGNVIANSTNREVDITLVSGRRYTIENNDEPISTLGIRSIVDQANTSPIVYVGQGFTRTLGVVSDPVSGQPENLVATPKGGSKILLNWEDKVTNETAFDVWRDGVKIASLAANSTSYLDESAPEGRLVNYQIQSIPNQTASAVVSVQTVALRFNAPSAFTANPLSGDHMRLTWDIGEYGVVYDRVDVYRNGNQIGSAANGQNFYDDLNAGQCTLTSPCNYQLRAFYNADYKDSAILYGVVYGHPVSTQDLTGKVGANFIELKWSVPENSGTVAVTEIWRNGGLIDSIHGSSTVYYDRDVSVGGGYNYQIRFKNGLGNSSSNLLQGIKFQAPATITNLAVQSSVGGLALSWTLPNTGGLADSYQVWRSGGKIASIDGDLTSYIDSTASAGSRYDYQLVAVNALGTSTSNVTSF